MGYVSKEDYRKQIDEIIDILDGKVDKVLKELEKQMIEESSKMNFEQAAYIRDRMLAIQRVNEKQKVSNITENNIDVIGIAKSEIEVCVEIFFVRGSKMVGREHYFFQDIREMEDKEIISGFIKQYYILRRFTRSGRWVAMPQLHLPVWQLLHRWQPSAKSAAVPM